jgi:hypothetical protein
MPPAVAAVDRSGWRSLPNPSLLADLLDHPAAKFPLDQAHPGELRRSWRVVWVWLSFFGWRLLPGLTSALPAVRPGWLGGCGPALSAMLFIWAGGRHVGLRRRSRHDLGFNPEHVGKHDAKLLVVTPR